MLPLKFIRSFIFLQSLKMDFLRQILTTFSHPLGLPFRRPDFFFRENVNAFELEGLSHDNYTQNSKTIYIQTEVKLKFGYKYMQLVNKNGSMNRWITKDYEP